ncbi:hypothetical protein [Pseudonocardia sp. KRD291]|uniref:hypothetical protein n=1 Tax=Pseudonocardia sp. KRD291 TaxID=2792007 RepID=UPI001C49E39E|nr:hypothetical protein [Pseudonocardia sp. KRD291]MBW0105403.1 hypothetical protein [Pseudonocardia sp. KRD291]
MNRSRVPTRRQYLPLLAAALLAVWIGGTFAAIAANGERGAGSAQELIARGSTALRDDDVAAFDELLLDGPDSDFARDYVERLNSAGSPTLSRTGPDAAEIRSGRLLVTLSLAQEEDRWYLSLLPPTG